MTHTALITGASSGIGYELTKLFAADDYDVVLVARREGRLQELAADVERQYGVTATVVPRDLTDPDGPRQLFDEVTDRGIEVHTLVNNAGFGGHGRFDETDIERETAMIDLNVTAVTKLMKLFARPMVERGEGAILNTASMVAIAPTPTQSVYSATKAYVLSLSESVGHELESEGITVTALCPGPVDTEFFDDGDFEESAVTDGPMNDPASVAQAGYDGLKNGKRVVVPATKMKALRQLTRVLSRRKVVSLAGSTVAES
jgi:hypothetical protein